MDKKEVIALYIVGRNLHALAEIQSKELKTVLDALEVADVVDGMARDAIMAGFNGENDGDAEQYFWDEIYGDGGW